MCLIGVFALTGLCVLLGVEWFTVVDRMNTVFKYHFEAWILLALAVALALPELVRRRAALVALPRIPKWRANGNFRYKINENLKANLGWRYASRPNSDLFGLVRGDSYGFQTEYFYVDTRIVWDINKKMKWGFGIENLNNDFGYVSHPMPRRTFVTDIKYMW